MEGSHVRQVPQSGEINKSKALANHINVRLSGNISGHNQVLHHQQTWENPGSSQNSVSLRATGSRSHIKTIGN